MSKIRNQTDRTSSKLYRQSRIKKLQATGFLVLAMSPIFVNILSGAGYIYLSNNQVKVVEQAQDQSSDVLQKIGQDEGFKASKTLDKEQLEYYYKTGQISKGLYRETLSYILSDEYKLDYAKASIPENYNLYNKLQKKQEDSLYVQSILFGGLMGVILASATTQYEMHKRGLTAKWIKKSRELKLEGDLIGIHADALKFTEDFLDAINNMQK